MASLWPKVMKNFLTLRKTVIPTHTQASPYGNWLTSHLRPFSGTQNTKIQLRNPYFRKAGFYWWRRIQISSINARRHKYRNILPSDATRDSEPLFRTVNNLDNAEWNFKIKDLKMSVKRLKMFTRLIKGLHIQDALDWLASIPTIRINPMFNVISYASKQLTNRNADFERLFIKTSMINYNTPMKFMRAQKNKKYVLMKSWRNSIIITIKHLSMDELFHRYYIRTKAPKSLNMDMRLALHDNRVPSDTIFQWYPYLNGHSRYWHKKNLSWLNKHNLFDYKNVREKWILQYKNNLTRKKNENDKARTLEN